MKAITDITIRDIRELSETCEEAKKEALRLMEKGDMDNYLKKLLRISHLQDELKYDLAA